MVDTNKSLDEAPTPTSTVVGVLAAVAVTGVMVVIGAVASLGQPEANASQIASPASEQVASPEEHRAFISQGHSRVSREGQDAPLPATF